MHPETKQPVIVEIPSGPGATAGFERVKIVPFLDGVVAIYCIVPDDFEFKSVEVKEESKGWVEDQA